MASKKVIAICGFGPGISTGVANLFASKGFSVGLLARTQEKLDKAAAELQSKHNVEAAGFSADLSNPAAVKAALGQMAERLGAITVLHWNPPAKCWGDVLGLSLDLVTEDLNMMLIGLLAAVQAVVPGMEAHHGGAILVTGAIFALADQQPDVREMIPTMGAIVPAMTKSAQRNLVFTLSAALQPKKIRVGEVVVSGVVSGSEFANLINNPGDVKPEDVAAAFWKIYSGQEEHVSITV